MHHTIVPEPCENEEPLIEYADERDRPLLIAPSSDAFPLRKKAVGAVLCDRRGRAFVRRRMSEEGMERGTFPLKHSFVPAKRGKRPSSAPYARRWACPMYSGVAVSAAFKPSGENVSLTLFIAELPGALPPVSLPEGHFLDREELEGMTKRFPICSAGIALGNPDRLPLEAPGTPRQHSINKSLYFSGSSSVMPDAAQYRGQRIGIHMHGNACSPGDAVGKGLSARLLPLSATCLGA